MSCLTHHHAGPGDRTGVDNPGQGRGPSVAETAGTPRAMERRATTFGREPLGGHDEQVDASRPAATASMTTSR